jgi:hypothetical protein
MPRAISFIFQLLQVIPLRCAFQLTPSHLSLVRPSTKILQSTSEDDNLDQTLIEWLTASGCDPGRSVRIDTKEGLRGLYANRDIRAREIIFKLPRQLALEVGDSLKDGDPSSYLVGSDFENFPGGTCGELVQSLTVTA